MQHVYKQRSTQHIRHTRVDKVSAHLLDEPAEDLLVHVLRLGRLELVIDLSFVLAERSCIFVHCS